MTNNAEHFWTRFAPDEQTGCWNFTGHIREGYGIQALIRVTGARHSRAHRIAWALAHNDGRMPDSATIIHHTCGNKICGNPDHLEAMTRGEHMHVHRGYGCRIHGYEGWGVTRKDRRGECRTCATDRQRRHRARVRAARASSDAPA